MELLSIIKFSLMLFAGLTVFAIITSYISYKLKNKNAMPRLAVEAVKISMPAPRIERTLLPPVHITQNRVTREVNPVKAPVKKHMPAASARMEKKETIRFEVLSSSDNIYSFNLGAGNKTNSSLNNLSAGKN